jgi:hypothetical protein
MRIVTLVSFYLAACLTAHAEDSACTTKDFRGVYAFHAQGTNVTNNTLITFAGALTADGDGKITSWKDQASIPATQPILPPNFKVVSDVLDRYEQAKSLGGEILYSVEPDCRIKISATFQGPTGAPSPLVWTGALAFGGKEALVMNASAQSPYLSLVTMKRAALRTKAEGK